MTLQSLALLLAAAVAVACSASGRAADSAGAVAHDSSMADHSAHAAAVAAPGDSAFAALQARGAREMGVDQYTSTHRFEPRPDGGRITLQRDTADPAGVAQIRTHLQEIARAFTAGDFSTPFAVHDRAVPGTDVMTARRAAITYTFAPLPGGGEVVMRSVDSAAVTAIHRFLAFQRGDHRAGGD